MRGAVYKTVELVIPERQLFVSFLKILCTVVHQDLEILFSFSQNTGSNGVRDPGDQDAKEQDEKSELDPLPVWFFDDDAHQHGLAPALPCIFLGPDLQR